MSDLPKKAEIRYLMPDGTRPIYIASDGGANAALNIQAKFENITVELFNARESGNQFSLDIQGFELHKHSSSIPNFYAIHFNLTVFISSFPCFGILPNLSYSSFLKFIRPFS